MMNPKLMKPAMFKCMDVPALVKISVYKVPIYAAHTNMVTNTIQYYRNRNH